MALVHYLFNHYGLMVKPGRRHVCPHCGHRHAFRVKRDLTIAKCFACGAYMLVTRRGDVYDSTTRRPAA